MYGRTGLDRFKKGQSLEPFSVTSNVTTQPASFKEASASKTVSNNNHQRVSNPQKQYLNQHNLPQKAVTPDSLPAQQVSQVGGGQSTWKPPDWAIEPRPGIYYLDVMKDGEVMDVIHLDKRKHIFGRQLQTCDFVLDHQSVSRQHAVVVPHKNGSIYVIDLGSAHGTFVANERLTKDSPVELEIGQSLRFAASTRIYILRKNEAALFPPPKQPINIDLPPPPDTSDEDAVLAYNTYINRCLNGLKRLDVTSKSTGSVTSTSSGNDLSTERPPKRIRRTRVGFKDQVGGELVEIVGVSDGADVETEPGPVGVKEGSLVGKYESLVQVTVVPKGKEHTHIKENNTPQRGVTEKLQEVLNKVKAPAKSGGIYDDLYGESFSAKVGSSWANAPEKVHEKPQSKSGNNDDENDDDLFG